MPLGFGNGVSKPEEESGGTWPKYGYRLRSKSRTGSVSSKKHSSMEAFSVTEQTCETPCDLA